MGSRQGSGGTDFKWPPTPDRLRRLRAGKCAGGDSGQPSGTLAVTPEPDLVREQVAAFERPTIARMTSATAMATALQISCLYIQPASFRGSIWLVRCSDWASNVVKGVALCSFHRSSQILRRHTVNNFDVRIAANQERLGRRPILSVVEGDLRPHSTWRRLRSCRRIHIFERSRRRAHSPGHRFAIRGGVVARARFTADGAGILSRYRRIHKPGSRPR
jgi:hypothetical protein